MGRSPAFHREADIFIVQERESRAMRRVERVYRSERGQAMVEYALILALVAGVAFAGLTAIGPKLTPIFQAVVNGFA